MTSALVFAALVTVAPPDEITLAPGESTELAIRVTVADGFHVQANPAANEFLIPLELTWEEDDAFDVIDTRYPEATEFRIPGTDETLLTYEGTFNVTVTVRAHDGNGERTLRGLLRYQACDDRSCRPPRTVELQLAARIQDSH